MFPKPFTILFGCHTIKDQMFLRLLHLQILFLEAVDASRWHPIDSLVPTVPMLGDSAYH